MIYTNKRLLIALVAVLTTVFISGCEKSTYYKLTDEEMTWLCYKNREKLNFAAPNGDLISYDVVIRVKAYKIEGKVYNEFTGASIIQVDDSTAVFPSDSNGELFIYKSESGLLVTYTWPHFALKKAPINGLIPTLANIGGLNFTDVFILDGSILADSRNYISKLWISKSNGVLQMEDINGTLWVRQF
jgi:hypothetical protein